MGSKILRKKTKYTVLAVILIVLTVFPGFFVPVSAEEPEANANGIKVYVNTEGLDSPPDITASAAVFLNAGTGKTVYEKNSRDEVFPASTVKIMTAIIVLENVGDLEGKTIISKYVVNNTAGNSLDPKMSEGEVFTVENLLYAMLVSGANDAALALAEYVSGSVGDFVDKMNARAVELGCEKTVFANPTGMHSPSMHTTASDMAKIAFHASKMQKFMEISGAPKYTIPYTNKERDNRPLFNRNHFISKAYRTQYYYSYARGMNYGYTPEAGYCLTTVAEQKGLTYLCVLIGSTDSAVSGSESARINCFSDARSLFEWAFSIYSIKPVITKKDLITEVEIDLSANSDTVTLIPGEDISVLLPKNADLEKEITTNCDIYEEMLVAPIDKGQELGRLTVYYNGEIVGSTKLLSNSDIERSFVLYILRQIKNIVSGLWFKASVISFIIIFTGYIIISLVRSNKKEQKRFY